MNHVSIIVINWNGREHLARGLPPLLAQRYPAYDVVLVDNGSTDGSVELVERDFPKIQLIKLDYNSGFVTANNIGIAASTGELVVTLNNDTVPDPDWLGALVDHHGEQVSVRDVLVHMVEEYARHCGHADLLRECIDGRTGQ